MNERTESGTGWEMDLKRAAWEQVAASHNLLERRRVERVRKTETAARQRWGEGRQGLSSPSFLFNSIRDSIPGEWPGGT